MTKMVSSMTTPDELRREREETIRTYFRKVDARDPGLLDLFTDDVRFFFPKYGETRGKTAVAEFGRRLQRFLTRLDHDIEGLNILISGDFAAAEGREWGVMRDGTAWPDGVISQGRFCNVFEFEGTLIRRAYIYVDPDFTNADRDRLRLLRGEQSAIHPVRSIVKSYFERLQAGAEPEQIAALFSEDADWDIPGAVDQVSWIGPRKGRDEVAAFFRLYDRILKRSASISARLPSRASRPSPGATSFREWRARGS